MKKQFFIMLLICSTSFLFSLGAFDIAINNDYTETIDVNDLIFPEAGSDIKSIYESPTNAVTLNITGADYPYHVEISRNDTNWPAGVKLLVRRTSDGIPTGNMLGGLNYQAVSSTDTYFFECTDPGGLGSKWNIGIQYRFEGVTLYNIEPRTYNTTIIFTVIDIQ